MWVAYLSVEDGLRLQHAGHRQSIYWLWPTGRSEHTASRVYKIPADTGAAAARKSEAPAQLVSACCQAGAAAAGSAARVLTSDLTHAG